MILFLESGECGSDIFWLFEHTAGLGTPVPRAAHQKLDCNFYHVIKAVVERHLEEVARIGEVECFNVLTINRVQEILESPRFYIRLDNFVGRLTEV